MKAVKSNNSNRQNSSASSSLSVPGGNVASNNHRQKLPPISPPTTIELRGVPIHFPFRPYACQKDYMEKVLDALFRSENALLESPTGTGKTLCLLCAALAWQRQEARKLHQPSSLQVDNAINTTTAVGTQAPTFRRVPTIIYASRTHSQLSQVVLELRNTRYRPKHAVLGSREQMCVNPKVKRAGSTGADINLDCNRLGKERKCAFRNKLEGFAAPSNEGTCGTQPVYDMEDLVTMGQQHRVCPFYYTRNLVEDAELILVPYNYLFDKDARTSTLADVPWKNAVLIFDEAHNLESFASESASFDLTTTDIAGCLLEIQRAINYVQTFGTAEDNSGKLRPDNIAKLKTIFLKLEDYIMNTLSPQTTAYKGEFMMELFQKGAGINHGNHELFIAEVRKLTDVFVQFGSLSSGKGNANRGGGGAPRLEHFIQCVRRVFGEPSEARCFAKAQSYRVHVTQKQSQPVSATGGGNKMNGNQNKAVVGRTVSYWCFAPSEAMRELANLGVRSILVTSGTLSPLESYALELDLPFPHRLENPHIIPDDQIHVRVIGKGVSNKILTSSYERRQDDEYYTELGNTLISLAKIVPGGMLVFFPSYGVMETCLEKWGGPGGNSSSRSQGNKTSSFFAARKRQMTGSARYSFPHAPYTYSASKEQLNPWKRLLGVKAAVVEPKSTADLPDAINEFHKHLNLPKSKGVVLFGVCRGKISEGIDFAHDMCRAVVITGLPFAPSFDPKVKMKREFLDHNRSIQSHKASTEGGFEAWKSKQSGLSGHEWYTQQAHRAVNQAVGRVIRNKNDYGAVLLLDNRFSLPGNQQGLSKWVRPHILPDEGMGRTIGALSRFYKEAAGKAEEREKLAPVPPPPNPVSIILRYEDDEGDDQRQGKENQQIVDEHEHMEVTKIAYVEKGPEEGEGANALSGDGADDESPGTSYIRPDRIIGRVDMEDDSKKMSGVLQAGAQSMAKSRPLLDTTLTRTSNAVPTAPKQSSPSLTPAQRFFQLVMQRMTKEEQSKMKRAAVEMKPVGGKCGPNFVAAAREMIGIILSYDTFEGRSRDDKPEMIDLLMQLFPKNILREMHQLTMLMMLDRSNFSRSLRDKVDPEAYRKARSEIRSLLLQVWFKDVSGEYLPAQGFLAQLDTILSSVLASLGSNGESSRDVALSDFVSLVPVELGVATTAFLDQLGAAMRISQLRAKEKASVGERSLQVERFRAPPVKKEPVFEDCLQVGKAQPLPPDEKLSDGTSSIGADEKSTRCNPYACVSKISKGVKSCKSDSHNQQPTFQLNANCPDRKGKTPNPYVKRSSSIERPRKVARADEPESKPKQHSVLSVIVAPVAPRCPTDKVKDPIRKALDELEADVFTGKNKSTVKTIESNAPKDWNCELCQNSCGKPFIAPCNHVACKSCWVQWFNKSKTCPQCRKPASVESLALVVFKQKPGTLDRSEP